MKKIGVTYIVPKIKEAVDEADLRTIFFDSDSDSDQGIDDPVLPDMRSEERLELPRPWPHDLDLSQTVVFIGETERSAKVFVVDSRDGTIYHATNFVRDKDRSVFMGLNGYAALGGKVYFIGGVYCDHDVEWSKYKASRCVRKRLNPRDESFMTEVDLLAKEIRGRHLEVPAFDLKTRCFDAQLSKLNSPKPYPTVFVYGGKIYVHAGRNTGQLHIREMVNFECLDPSSDSGLTWSQLPDPTHASPVMLNIQRGTLLAIKDHVYREEKTFDEFDLTSHEWRSSNDTLYDVTPVADLCNFAFEGCFVNNFFFYYENLYKPEMPVIRVYDVRERGQYEYSTISLSEAVRGHRIHRPRRGFLNHLGHLRFSLVIFYSIPSLDGSVGVCTILFELLQPSNVAQRETSEPKKPKIEKSIFTLGGNLLCRTFQLPSDLEVFFCKKMM